ncbi:LysM peptidoglycan-binding domain-containing protein [Sulfurivirga sp.]|uniref:LysM peptidoglycan-binding domain-containing protein n=1 Tax=Sulfurivirga sp. TaxID=2614236 RepID=UPI0025D0FAA7|nr:LysM peptidoglycan-binding domain-containing protein [Sulfurivirga sp.]
MIVIQDSKVSTVVVWVSTIIIFLLLGLIALMAGIVYNKKSSLEEQLAMETPAPAAAMPAPAGQAPAQQLAKAVPAPAVPAQGKAPATKTIYVLINGKLVPLEVAAEQAQMVNSDLEEFKRYQQSKKQPVQVAASLNDEQARQAVAKHEAVDPTIATNNRVVLSQDDMELSGKEGQLQQIAQIAVYQARKKTEVKKLLQEAEQQEKKMRLIKVRPGDSLWTIAVRAYGNGFKYKKILEANPQIKNPERLAVGMILRVPE